MATTTKQSWWYPPIMTSSSHDFAVSLQWRHTGRDSVSNHQLHDCLLNRLFRRKSKKTSKLRATGHCAGNSPGTGELPTQMASNAENVSIWWRHHVEFLQNTRVISSEMMASTESKGGLKYSVKFSQQPKAQLSLNIIHIHNNDHNCDHYKISFDFEPTTRSGIYFDLFYFFHNLLVRQYGVTGSGICVLYIF